VKRYSGWSNRETWATALHINNDSGLLDPLAELAKNYDMDDEETEGEFCAEVENFICEILDWGNVKENRQAFLMLQDIGSLYQGGLARSRAAVSTREAN
jgi:hypothetical protein